MEVVHHQGRRICREQISPERGKMSVQGRSPVIRVPTFKKVQVVYYLSRNGHLEHPHYMEVTHLSHQPLRLKDVVDRLTALRGKGMPSLYSWSCKRSYKNGYVWNDLAENDVIYPSEGAEYVLKGSELIEGCTEKMHNLQVNNIAHLQLGNMSHHQTGLDSRPQPKPQHLGPKRRPHPQDTINSQYLHDVDDHQENIDDEEEQEEEYDHQEKHNYTNPHLPTCSRGVSTDEFKQKNTSTSPSELLTLETNSFSSPPSTTSSTSLSDNTVASNNTSSKSIEDGDPVGNEPLLSRSSMLFSLIACGGSASFRKIEPAAVAVKESPATLPPSAVARKSGSGVSLHKGVVCKAAAKKVAVEEEEEMMMISCMSENPRFGNMQAEEKEYFSGSIVEAMVTDERLGNNEPGLKKSSSYNEERSSKADLGEAALEEEVKREKGVKGKCIPRMKSSSKQTKK